MDTILKKETRGNFTTFSNEVWDDKNGLSHTARGILGLLLSKPPNWTIRIAYIVAAGQESEARVKKALRELAKAGFLMRDRERGEDGAITTVTRVADWPAFLEVGTPERRIYGYDIPSDSPTLPNVRGREGQGSVDGGVIIKTDVVKTERIKTNPPPSSSTKTKKEEEAEALLKDSYHRLNKFPPSKADKEGRELLALALTLVETYGYSYCHSLIEKVRERHLQLVEGGDRHGIKTPLRYLGGIAEKEKEGYTKGEKVTAPQALAAEPTPETHPHLFYKPVLTDFELKREKALEEWRRKQADDDRTS